MSMVDAWPQQPEDDLRVDVAYRVHNGSQALNSKYAGVLPEGVYHGFDVLVSGDGSEFKVNVGSNGRNVALAEIEHPSKAALSSSMTARMPEGMFKELTVSKGIRCYVVLNIFYKSELNLSVDDQTSASVEVVTSLTEEDHRSKLVLAEVNAPVDAPALVAGHIQTPRKIVLTSENAESSNPIPDTYDGQYTIASGTGALAGEFVLYDSYTGGFIEFTALHSEGGEVAIHVDAHAGGLVRSISIYENAGAIELRIAMDHESIGADSRMFVDFRAYDGHNESSIGWNKVYSQSSATGTEVEKLNLYYVDAENKDRAIGTGSTGELSELGETLAKRYLGINGKAKDSEKSDVASLANDSKTSRKLDVFPASFFGVNWFDLLNDDYKDAYADKVRDPDRITDAATIINHSKMPSDDDYLVVTKVLGSSISAIRLQVAIRISPVPSASDLSDAVEFRRWVSGNYTSPIVTGWSSNSLTADSARKLAGTPASHIPTYFIDPSDSALIGKMAEQDNAYPATGTDPDFITHPMAVLSHATKLPLANEKMFVTTKSYGSPLKADFVRVQEALPHSLVNLNGKPSRKFSRLLFGAVSGVAKAVSTTDWEGDVVASFARMTIPLPDSTVYLDSNGYFTAFSGASVTVGNNSEDDFSTLSEAIDYLQHTYHCTGLVDPINLTDFDGYGVYRGRSRAAIIIQDGYVITESLDFSGSNLSWIEIYAAGNREVVVDLSDTGNSIFIRSDRGSAPLCHIDILMRYIDVNGEIHDGSDPAVRGSYTGYYAGSNGSVFGSGVRGHISKAAAAIGANAYARLRGSVISSYSCMEVSSGGRGYVSGTLKSVHSTILRAVESGSVIECSPTTTFDFNNHNASKILAQHQGKVTMQGCDNFTNIPTGSSGVISAWNGGVIDLHGADVPAGAGVSLIDGGVIYNDYGSCRIVSSGVSRTGWSIHGVVYGGTDV